MTSNVKERVNSWRLSRSKPNGIISQVNISSKRGLLCNSVSVTAIMSNTLFMHLSRWSRSSTLLFKEHALIWNKARDLCLLQNFKVWIWSKFFLEKFTEFNIQEPNQREVIVKTNFYHPWFIVERVWYGRDEVLIR